MSVDSESQAHARQGHVNHPILQASWIWCNVQPEVLNQHGLFRRSFDLTAAPTAARVSLCADSRYWLYVNGERVGFGPARYHLPEPCFDQHDITALLRPGRNVVAVRVVGYGKVSRCSSFMAVRCGLIATIEVDHTVHRTDETWRARHETAYASDTPRHSAHQGFVECFDARKAALDWQSTDFDDRNWSAATVLGRTEDLPPWRCLQPRPVPHLTLEPRLPRRIIEFGCLEPAARFDVDDMKTHAEMLADARRSPDVHAVRGVDPVRMLPATFALSDPSMTRCSAYALFDFDSNSAGYVTLKMRGQPGAVVDIAYAESLPGGTLDVYKQGVRYADRVILGDAPLTWQTPQPKTLRYLLVAVRGQAVIEQVVHEVSTFPLAWRGGFNSDDEVLEHAWRVGAHTVQIASEDTFLDTPRRERAGWLADARVEAFAAYHAFGENLLPRHSLDLFFKSQDMPGRYIDFGADHPGWVISRYPSIDGSRMPDFTAGLAMQVNEYLMYTGDQAWTRRIWPQLLRAVSHIESYRTADDLIVWSGFAIPSYEYILIDWAPIDRRGACAALNMIHAGNLAAAAAIARVLDDQSEASRLTALHARQVRAIRDRLWDAERGIYVNTLVDGRLTRRAGYHENLLALLWDIATPEQRPSIERQLLAGDTSLPMWEPEEHYEMYPLLRRGEVPPWDDEQLVPIGSPYFTFFALWALFEIGRAGAALNTIRGQYGKAFARGATSTWEEWNGGASHSHGWGAAPTALLGRAIVGIEPLEPGFTRFAVLPTLADLKHASARVPTPHGIIQATWRRDHSSVNLEITVPPGTTATVGLPTDVAAALTVNGTPTPATRMPLRRGDYLVTSISHGRHMIASAGEVTRPSA